MPILTPGQKRKSGRRWTWAALVALMLLTTAWIGCYLWLTPHAIHLGEFVLYGPRWRQDHHELLLYGDFWDLGPFWITREDKSKQPQQLMMW